MNNPLKVDPPGLQKAFYTLSGSLLLFAASVIWYGSQFTTQVYDRLGAVEHQVSLMQGIVDKLNSDQSRIDALERQQGISTTLETKLDNSREETNLSLAKLSGRVDELTSNVKAVLDFLQQDSGGTQTSAPPNFPQHQPTGGPPY